jgi:hypothetical protein
LQAQGVNVEAFLARLGQEGGIKPSTADAKKPTASERLRALASRAGSKVNGLLGDLNADDTVPAAAYGRSGRRGKGARASSRGKQNRQPKK